MCVWGGDMFGYSIKRMHIGQYLSLFYHFPTINSDFWQLQNQGYKLTALLFDAVGKLNTMPPLQVKMPPQKNRFLLGYVVA